MHLLRFRTVNAFPDASASAEFLIVRIENNVVNALFGDAHFIIIPLYGSKIAYGNNAFALFVHTPERDNGVVRIVADYP